ncbi:MAG: sugar kinase [Actinobacteria bacterium]|nr:sugar kinase [Actinomycetota bacterium]
MSDNGIDVVTVGIHIVDILGRPVPAVPEGQGVALLEEIRMTVAGTAAGTSVDLARLGMRVATFGVIGNDELGVWLIEKMQREGIDVAGLTVDHHAPTSATMLPIRPNGERPALHVIGANALLSSDHLDWEKIESATVLHVGGTFLLESFDGAPTANTLKRAKEAGVTTTLDIIGMPGADVDAVLGPCFPYLDYFLPNDEDAFMLSGTSTLSDAVQWFHHRGVGATVITLGADGACVGVGNTIEAQVPAYAVDVVDTTGCGDAFSAGFIVGLIEGRDPVGASELGVAAGSLVATGLGSDAGITNRIDLDAFIDAKTSVDRA